MNSIDCTKVLWRKITIPLPSVSLSWVDFILSVSYKSLFVLCTTPLISNFQRGDCKLLNFHFNLTQTREGGLRYSILLPFPRKLPSNAVPGPCGKALSSGQRSLLYFDACVQTMTRPFFKKAFQIFKPVTASKNFQTHKTLFMHKE